MKVAEYKHKDGRIFELYTNQWRGLYWNNGTSTDIEFIYWLVKEGILKSTGIYHCYHICYCEKCKGKRWEHSQGDWDAHLKFVKKEDIVTLP